MKKLALLAAIMLVPTIACANVLGTVGRTYPFAEPDALTEITERAKRIDWKRMFAKAGEEARHFRPEIPDLPQASKARMRQVEMSYTLDVDVPDPKNPSRILYPKGWSFNPLQYVTLPACVLFVDLGDRAQREWLVSSGMGRDPLTPVLLTGGDQGKTEKIIKRPVYYADRLLLERFGIEAVPSLACQRGTTMEVEEIDVRKTDR